MTDFFSISDKAGHTTGQPFSAQGIPAAESARAFAEAKYPIRFPADEPSASVTGATALAADATVQMSAHGKATLKCSRKEVRLADIFLRVMRHSPNARSTLH